MSMNGRASRDIVVQWLVQKETLSYDEESRSRAWCKEKSHGGIMEFELDGSLKEWAKDKPLSILQLDPADRAVLRIAGEYFRGILSISRFLLSFHAYGRWASFASVFPWCWRIFRVLSVMIQEI